MFFLPIKKTVFCHKIGNGYWGDPSPPLRTWGVPPPFTDKIRKVVFDVLPYPKISNFGCNLNSYSEGQKIPTAASAPLSIRLKVSALYPPQLSAQGQFFLTKDLGSRC